MPFQGSSGSSARLGDEGAVDLAGGEQCDEQSTDGPAVLHAVGPGRGPHRVLLDDRAEPLGRRAARDFQ